jgi:hypothetical protein
MSNSDAELDEGDIRDNLDSIWSGTVEALS